MCGIAGYSRIHPGSQCDLLDVMGCALAHRGPDSRGEFNDKHVGLVHTRLSIIDLEGGGQPLVSADGRLILIANGEIYNHIELREELERHGCQFYNSLRLRDDSACLC